MNLTDFFEKFQNGKITILDGLKSLPTITESNHCLVYNFINDIYLWVVLEQCFVFSLQNVLRSF